MLQEERLLMKILEDLWKPKNLYKALHLDSCCGIFSWGVLKMSICCCTAHVFLRAKIMPSIHSALHVPSGWTSERVTRWVIHPAQKRLLPLFFSQHPKSHEVSGTVTRSHNKSPWGPYWVDTLQASLMAPRKVESPSRDTLAVGRGISSSKWSPTFSFTIPEVKEMYAWHTEALTTNTKHKSWMT